MRPIGPLGSIGILTAGPPGHTSLPGVSKVMQSPPLQRQVSVLPHGGQQCADPMTKAERAFGAAVYLASTHRIFH